MTKERSINWLLAAVLAGALLAGCGGGEAASVGSAGETRCADDPGWNR